MELRNNFQSFQNETALGISWPYRHRSEIRRLSLCDLKISRRKFNNAERIYQNHTLDKWSDKVALSAPPSDIFIIYLHTLEQFHVDFRDSHISVQITVTNCLFSRTIF